MRVVGSGIASNLDGPHHLAVALVPFILDFIEAFGLPVAAFVAGAGVELKQSEVCRIVFRIELNGAVKTGSGLGIVATSQVDLSKLRQYIG